MLRQLPKVLLLVALLTALAVSNAPIFGYSCYHFHYCVSSIKAANCSIDSTGKCASQACTSGGPCNYSECASLSFRCYPF